MESPLEMAQPSLSRRLPESNRCKAPQGNVSVSAPLLGSDDVAYLLRLCEAAGDDPVQMRGNRLAAILRRLQELEAAKRQEFCPHGFHIFAMCAWCWFTRKADNSV